MAPGGRDNNNGGNKTRSSRGNVSSFKEASNRYYARRGKQGDFSASNDTQKAPNNRRPEARINSAGVAVGSSRAFWPIVLFAAFALIIFGRLVYLQVIMADEYSAMAAASRTADIETSPRRGTIYDRNGNILALSVDATTIYANPSEVTDVVGEAEALASVLGGYASDYTEKLEQDQTTFVYIERKADVDIANQVKELNLDGIYFLDDVKREYPYGEIGGQIIGFCNVDGEGISGLELYYDDILSGTPGRLVVERSANGVPIPGSVTEQTAAIDGQDIMVSIDIELQEVVEYNLVNAHTSIEGSGASCMIMDAGTGEIYASASLPLFNPADTSVVEEGATSLKTITSAFEPGSIFKTASAMALFETQTVTADTEFFCPSKLEADEYYISDAHPRDDTTMTFRQIIADSSNVGISLAVAELGFIPYYQYLQKYGIGELTGVDYPGESSGYLADVNTWSLVQAYNISFGQGVSVTPMQMVSLYGLLANNGVRCTPHFLTEYLATGQKATYEEQEVIVDKQAIEKTTDVLQSVVAEGTGTEAQIAGYDVAGKTGTAEIAAEGGGYEESLYNLSFVGYLPNTNSKLVCFVGATEVPYERNTAWVFRDIMSYAIDHYQIVSN